jgi:hypothetical protein
MESLEETALNNLKLVRDKKRDEKYIELGWKALQNKTKKEKLKLCRLELGIEENHQTHLILIPENLYSEKTNSERGNLKNPCYLPKDLAGYIITHLLKKKADITRYDEKIMKIINTNGKEIDIQGLRETATSIIRFTSDKSLINSGIILFEEFKELKKGEKMNYFSIRSLYKNGYATIRGFKY